MATRAHQKANDEGRARHSVRAGSTTGNIGAHYLALVNGKAADSNGDGVPDFLADRNGNGDENADEMPWQSPNSGPLTILSPADGATVSGIAKIQVNLGAYCVTALSIGALVDGQTSAESVSIVRPAESLAIIEIDTRMLSDGEHALSVHAPLFASTPDDPFGVSSDDVFLNVQNLVRFPTWERQAGAALTVDMQVPLTQPNCLLHFFGATYPVTYNPTSLSYREIAVTGGNISFTADLAELGYGDADADPILYTIAELPSASSQAAPTPPHLNPPYFPPTGKWVVAYDESAADFAYSNPSLKILDPEDQTKGVIPGEGRFPLWFHDNVAGHLGVQAIGNSGWLSCGPRQGTIPLFKDAASNPTGDYKKGQTFPKRGAAQGLPADLELVKGYLTVKSAKNFYGNAHGLPSEFMGFSSTAMKGLNLARYRFVFLDGCFTAHTPALLEAFGAKGFEFREQPLIVEDYKNFSLNKDKVRPGVFIGWRSEVPLAYRLTPPQADYVFKHYTSRCNWHAQVIFQWTMNNRTIREAINEANNTATVIFEQSEQGKNWTLAPVEAPGTEGQIRLGIKNAIFGNPSRFLRIYGCSDLKFNDYNSALDWPPANP